MAEGGLVIVTAASENHARPLFHLLESLDRYEPDTRVVVYDLGLAPRTAARLRRQGRNLVPFRFDDYPPHVDAGNLSNFAWKPALIVEVVREHGLPLLYLDAGDLVHERLDRVRQEIDRIGFYSSRTTGTIADWCHPATVSALRVEPDVLAARNRTGGIIGFGDTLLAREIVRAYFEAAMKPEIICPPGSSLLNHRYDQSILGVLLTRAIRRHGLDATEHRLGISVQNDELSAREARHYVQCDPAIPRQRALRRFKAERLWRAGRRAWWRIKAAVARG